MFGFSEVSLHAALGLEAPSEYAWKKAPESMRWKIGGRLGTQVLSQALEGSRRRGEGYHAQTLRYLVNLFLIKSVRISVFSSLFTAIAVFLALRSGKMC